MLKILEIADWYAAKVPKDPCVCPTLPKRVGTTLIFPVVVKNAPHFIIELFFDSLTVLSA